MSRGFFGPNSLSIAFPKGSPLGAEFDAVITDMKANGEIDELVLKWFGDRSPVQSQPTS